ncbi:MAG TPA: helix-turn-helix transcriptional regulator [Caproiciproducens sp.]|nr:helix-turn-helix transcriptional regulator [Caproiciproducens sp.]
MTKRKRSLVAGNSVFLYTFYEVVKVIFAEKLQTLRKGNGMSQESLAEALGVSRQAVSKWESGQSYPEMDKMIALSDLFHVSMDYLVKDASPAEEGNRYPAGFNAFKSMLHYEYKSKRKLGNLPLVHINIGHGFYVAKGVIAIGNIAIGCAAFGALAVGGLCFGAFALGLLGIGGVALHLLLSFGGISVGAVAFGGVAVGIITFGGLSIGMFSVGGCAIASHIAIGGFAKGHIAIGDSVEGIRTICIHDRSFRDISAQEVRDLINQEFPNLWQPIVNAVTAFFG